MPELGTALYAFLCLLLGGTLKGVVGIGLPLMALPLLAYALPLKTAVAIMVLPVFAANLAQSFQGGMVVPILKRFWPVIMALVLCIAVSVKALVLVPEEILFLIIGAALILVTVAMRFQPKLRLAPSCEAWAGPLTGAVAGALGGISGIYGPPLMLYLASLRLAKDEFVPAVALLFFAGNLGLAAGLLSFGIASVGDLGLSAVAIVPTFVGLWLGRRVQMRLDERRFAIALDVVYLVTGASFLLRAAI